MTTTDRPASDVQGAITLVDEHHRFIAQEITPYIFRIISRWERGSGYNGVKSGSVWDRNDHLVAPILVDEYWDRHSAEVVSLPILGTEIDAWYELIQRKTRGQEIERIETRVWRYALDTTRED